jgi:hypothetical protein
VSFGGLGSRTISGSVVSPEITQRRKKKEDEEDGTVCVYSVISLSYLKEKATKCFYKIHWSHLFVIFTFLAKQNCK